MGSASSKAARKLPKRANTPTWADTRTSIPDSKLATEASKLKSQVIDKDSRDPQLLQNLSRLGPVKVDHHTQSFSRQDERVNMMHQARAQSEAEAIPSNAARNRMLSSTLSELLEERKHVSTQGGLESLANNYGLDVANLESLARYINTPTIGEGTTETVRDGDGGETIMSKAVWTNPSFVAKPTLGRHIRL